MTDPTRLRDGLVSELRSRGVIHSEAIAAAFAMVPREHFIPEVVAEQGLEAAYQDRAFPTKHDRQGMPISSSSQPAIMAEMLELLELAPGQRVLEIGAGTGYNAAVLSQLVGAEGRVTTIDIDPEIVGRAKRALGDAGYRADVRQGDGRAGFAKHQPYDRIIVTASADQLQPAWLEQLAEGGRIIVPLRLDPDADAIQLIPVFERRGQWLRSLETTSGGFMPLHGGDGGWRSPPASLTAARHRPGKHSAVRVDQRCACGSPVRRRGTAPAGRHARPAGDPQRGLERGGPRSHAADRDLSADHHPVRATRLGPSRQVARDRGRGSRRTRSRRCVDPQRLGPERRSGLTACPLADAELRRVRRAARGARAVARPLARSRAARTRTDPRSRRVSLARRCV